MAVSGHFFRELGKTPVAREQFKMAKMEGPTVSRTSLRNVVGMESKAQEDDFICKIVSTSTGNDIGWKVVRCDRSGGLISAAL